MGWLISKALMRDYENSHCSQERAAESLVDTCLDGEPSAQSNTSHTPQAYLSSDKMTAFSRLSRFGMTFAPLTESHGEAVLTWFREGFPAKTLAPQAEAQALTESEAGYGARWPESLAKYDPDTRSWRTAQYSLLGGLDEFSETWPRWGTMQNAEFWEHPMPPGLAEIRQFIMTASESGFSQKAPTPTVCGNHNRKGASKTSGDGLATWVKARKVPTPQASDNRDRGGPSMRCVKRRMEIGKQVLLSQTVDGPLNPPWVEWLMDWPEGWTNLRPLAMDRFRAWQQQHSISWRGE